MLTSLCNQPCCFDSAQIDIIHCVTLIASPTASHFILNARHSLLDCPQCLNNLPKDDLWFRVSRASIGVFYGMDTLLWFLSILTHFHHLRRLAITISCPIGEFCAHCLIQRILTYLLAISYWFHRSARSCIQSAHMQHPPSPLLCLCTDLLHHKVSLAVSACLGICQNRFLRRTPMKAEESGRANASLGTRQEGRRFEDVGLSLCALPLRILVLGFQRSECWRSAEVRDSGGGNRGVCGKYSMRYSNWGVAPSACTVFILYSRDVKSGSSPVNSGQVRNDLQGGKMGRVLLRSGVVGRGSRDRLDSTTGSWSVDPLRGFQSSRE